nr:hypothetical protein BaRGS_021631 [Batillaria attramentaria]
MDLETGDCLLDDIVATKELCILLFNESFYDHLVELQREILHNRSQAVQQYQASFSTSAPGVPQDVSPTTQEVPQGGSSTVGAFPTDVSDRISDLHKLPLHIASMLPGYTPNTDTGVVPGSSAGNPGERPGPTNEPVVDVGVKSAPVITFPLDQTDDPQGLRSVGMRTLTGGPSINMGTLDSLGYLESPPTGVPKKLIGHNKRAPYNGPSMNMGTLDSLGYLENPPTGEPKKLIGHNKRAPYDGPSMNMGTLDSLGYLENPPTGEPKKLIGHNKRAPYDGPSINMGTLDSLGYLENPPTGEPKKLIGHNKRAPYNGPSMNMGTLDSLGYLENPPTGEPKKLIGHNKRAPYDGPSMNMGTLDSLGYLENPPTGEPKKLIGHNQKRWSRQ